MSPYFEFKRIDSYNNSFIIKITLSISIVFIFISFSSTRSNIYHRDYKNHLNESILFFIIIFLSHSFQAFDSSTGILTISQESDFTSASTYKSSTKYVIISTGITSIPSSAFYQWTSLLSVTISDTVKSMGTYAFYYCTNLVTVFLGEILETIDNYAFRYCSSINNITIPDSVTSIGSYAFYSCTNLVTMILGESVSSIGNCAFMYCNNLMCIYFYGELSPTFGSSLFIYFSHDCNDTWNISKRRI